MIGKKEISFCFFESYPTNLPYAHILSDFIDDYASRGYSVNVLTKNKPKQEKQQLFQRNKSNNIHYAFSLVTGLYKLDTYILYPLFIFLKLLFAKKQGAVIVPSTPSVIMGLSVALAKFLRPSSFKLIYHCQDIHPEALIFASILKNKILINLLKSLDNFTLSQADKVIVLSKDMQKTLIARKVMDKNKLKIVNNFVPSAYTENKSKQKKIKNIRHNIPSDGVVFVFAGNLGRFQNLDSVVQGFLQCKNNKVWLIFIGDGCAKQELIKKVALSNKESNKNIVFINKMEGNRIASFIKDADFGLVSVSPSMLDAAYPSKIPSYLSVGLPIFLVADKNSTLSHFIIKKQFGIVCSADSIHAITTAFTQAVNQVFQYKQQKATRYRAYQDEFNQRKLIQEFSENIQ